MKYTSKRVEIEAIQFKGDNLEEIKAFLGENYAEDTGEHYIRTSQGYEKLDATSYIVRESEGAMYSLHEETFKNHFEKPKIITEKSLANADVNQASKNVPDLVVLGNGDTFKLICKASSKKEGWMKSTKAMQVNSGVVLRITTQQGDNVAEAAVFIPGAKIHYQKDKEGNIVGQTVL